MPLCHSVGEISDSEVRLLEIPYAQGDKRAFAWLRKRLRRLERREIANGGLRLGLPLDLAVRLSDDFPDVLAAGRRLACCETVRRLERQLGGLIGAEVGISGLDERWQCELVDKLCECGARVTVNGGFAERLAAEYWQRGVALPILSVRKMLEVCDRVIVMRDIGLGRQCAKVVVFAEPSVFVEGHFAGRFCFGMFPAGMAAAIEQDFR